MTAALSRVMLAQRTDAALRLSCQVSSVRHSAIDVQVDATSSQVLRSLAKLASAAQLELRRTAS